MDLGLIGKKVVVTGSSRNLGKHMAMGFALEGADVSISGRYADVVSETAAEIRTRTGVQVIESVVDFQTVAGVAAMAATVKQEMGGIDVLVINTGPPPDGLKNVMDVTDDAIWEAACQIQLMSAIRLVHGLVPLMRGRGGGRIITITSASVKAPMPHHAVSTVFRVGVAALAKHLANELAAENITVNNVCPASVESERFKRAWDPSERIKHVPMRRLGKPEELTGLVLFLASQYAGFITGTSTQVDGGQVASL